MNLGLLGALAGASKVGLGEYEEDRKRDQDNADQERKAKLAESLQEKLAQRKMELAQQFPEYTMHSQDPRTGAMTGITRFGQSSQLIAPDPTRTQQYDDLQNAKLGLLAGQTASTSASTAANNARATSITDRTNNPGKYKNPPKAGADPLALSPSAWKAMAVQLAAQIDPEAFGPQSPLDKLSDMGGATRKSKQADVMKQAYDHMTKKGYHMKGEASGDSMFGGDDATEAPANPFADTDADTNPEDPNDL